MRNTKAGDYVEEYFKWKIILDYVVPLGILSIVGIVFLIYIACQAVKDIMVANFFEKNGYTREVFGVASFGGKTYYGWVRKTDNMRVDESVLGGMSLKKIKEKYK